MHSAELKTQRFILKGFSPADMNAVFETLPKEEIKKLLGHRTELEFQTEANKQKNGYAAYNRSFLLFLIADKETNAVVGRCGIHNWNKEHRRAEVGYIVNEEFRDKGIMTEVLAAVLSYGFHNLQLHRIEALVGTENEASLKLMKKFNFVQEGTLRKHYFINDVHVDSIMFSLLQSEFTNT